jgi:hypothetical protein
VVESVSKKDYGQPTSFKLDPALLEELREMCHQRRTTRTQAVEEGLRLWLAAPQKATQAPSTAPPGVPSMVGISPEEHKWIGRLLHVLRRGPGSAVVAVVADLLTFAELTEISPREGDSGEDPSVADARLSTVTQLILKAIDYQRLTEPAGKAGTGVVGRRRKRAG